MSTSASANVDSIILEEEIDPNYIPSQDEINEYAKWLGIDFEKDKDLFWIAREGLMAPLPKNWKPCKTKDTDDIYYFNFTTGESTWDHPCDGYYKRLYEEEKKKKELAIKESKDEKKNKEKQDVVQLLGKVDKKKKRTSVSPQRKLNDISDKNDSTALKALEKKPLPRIAKIDKPLADIAPISVNEVTTSKSKVLTRFNDAIDSNGQQNSRESARATLDNDAKPVPIVRTTNERDDISKNIQSRDSTPKDLINKSSMKSPSFNDNIPLSTLSSRPQEDSSSFKNSEPRSSKRIDLEEKQDKIEAIDRDRDSRATSRSNDPSVYAEEVASLHKKLKDLRDERNRAFEEKESLEDECSNLKIKNCRLEASNDTITEEMTKLKMMTEENSEFNTRKESSLRMKLNDAENSRQQMMKLESQVIELTELCKVKDQDIKFGLKQINEVESHNSTLEKKIKLLEQQNKDLAIEVTTADDRMVILKSDMMDLRKRLNSNQSSDLAATNELQNHIDGLEEKILEKNSIIAKLKSDLTKKSNDLDSSDNELSKLKRKLQKVEEEMKILTHQYEEVSMSLTSEKLSSNDMKIERNSLQMKVTRLESEISNHLEIITRLKQPVENVLEVPSVVQVPFPNPSFVNPSFAIPSIQQPQSNFQIAELESQLNFAKNEIDYTKSELKALYEAKLKLSTDFEVMSRKSTLQLNEEQTKVKLMEDTIRKLKQDHHVIEENSKGMLSEKNLQLKRAENSLQELETRYIALERELIVARQSIVLKDSELQEINHNLEKSLSTIASHEIKLKGYQDQIIHLQKNIDSIEKQNIELQSKLEEAKAVKVVASEATKESDTHVVAELQAKLIMKETEISQLQKTFSTTSEQLLVMSKSNHAYVEEIKQFKSHLDEIMKEKRSSESALIAKMKSLTDENSQLVLDVTNMKKELAATKLDCSHLQADVDNKKRDLDQLAQRYEQLQNTREAATIKIIHQDENHHLSPEPWHEIGLLLTQQQAVVQRLEEKLDGTEKAVASLSIHTAPKPDLVKIDTELPSYHKTRMQYRSETSDDELNSSSDSAVVRKMMTKFQKSNETKHHSTNTWKKKLNREQEFINELQRKQNSHRKQLRLQQQELLLLRSQWKSSKLSSRKISAKALNKKVSSLNKDIKDWKDLNDWIDERIEKIKKIENTIKRDDKSKRNSDLLSSLFQELDDDLSSFGDSLVSDQTPSSDLDYMSDVTLTPYSNEKQRSKSVPHLHHKTYDFMKETPRYQEEAQLPIHQIVVPRMNNFVKLTNSENIRKELRELSEDQRIREQAYEKHSDWLLSLRNEIGSFNPSLKENTHPSRIFVSHSVS